MSIIVLSYLPSILGIGLLAAVTYLNNPKARINRTITVFATGVFLWLFSLMLADTATSDTGALWSLRAALFIGSIIGTSFLMFADSFPDESLRSISDRTFKVLWFITAIFMVLSLTDYMFPTVANSETESTLESLTLAYILQTIFVLGQMFIGAFITLRRRHKVTPQQRSQILLFGYGMIITVFASIVPNVLFIILDVTSIWTPFLTSFSYFVLVLSMWFAITRHQLFHIRGIIARAIAYVASAFIVVSAYAFIVGRVIDLNVSSQSLRVLLTGFSFLVAILVFGKITQIFNHITNSLFYREAYSTRAALGQLTDALVSHIELPELLKASRKVIVQTLKPVHGAVVIYDSKKRVLDNPKKQVTDVLGQILPARSRSAASSQFIDIDSTTTKKEELMRQANIQLVVPIYAAQKLEGCIVLGPRSSGEVYSRQDLEFLKIAARNIGLAVNNAKSYQQISEFNVTLRKKVRQATEELRTKNMQLEGLHKTKDDFISMASHQLRPKIAASQGFLDLLDRSGLKTNKEQSELLELTSRGIERMSDIVVDMLDISRMDADHMVLELSEKSIDIVSLVADEVADVSEATKRSFTLETTPKNAQISMRVDQIKFREVLANLLHNAAQYSKDDTSITVKVSGSKQHVSIIVSDKGMGMTQTEKNRLFEKFYRSKAAKTVRPNGSGVGLYMSKKIIEAHGGTMTVTSQKGKGSSIGFRLPLKS